MNAKQQQDNELVSRLVEDCLKAGLALQAEQTDANVDAYNQAIATLATHILSFWNAGYRLCRDE